MAERLFTEADVVEIVEDLIYRGMLTAVTPSVGIMVRMAVHDLTAIGRLQGPG